MLNLVLFGPPGAGKGTQSQMLIDKYRLVHLSTGDILRSEIAAETELGLKAKILMDEGNLVPDEVVIGMIDARIKSNPDANGFIFDGFPRTVNQAEALDHLLNDAGTPISCMISLKVPREELVNRLLERGKTSGRADDQNEEKVNNRIEVYKSETLPVADYYQAQGKLQEVNGFGSIESIFDSLCAVLDQY